MSKLSGVAWLDEWGKVWGCKGVCSGGPWGCTEPLECIVAPVGLFSGRLWVFYTCTGWTVSIGQWTLQLVCSLHVGVCFSVHWNTSSTGPLPPPYFWKGSLFLKSLWVHCWQIRPPPSDSVCKLFLPGALHRSRSPHMLLQLLPSAEWEPGLSLTISSTGYSINKGMRSGAVVCDMV